MMKLKPIHDQILVRLKNPESQTKSGLFIPETARSVGVLEGEVLDVGDGRWTEKGLIPLTVMLGQRILFRRRVEEHQGKTIELSSAVDVELDGNKYVVLREHDVIGILSGDVA